MTRNEKTLFDEFLILSYCSGFCQFLQIIWQIYVCFIMIKLITWWIFLSIELSLFLTFYNLALYVIYLNYFDPDNNVILTMWSTRNNWLILGMWHWGKLKKKTFKKNVEYIVSKSVTHIWLRWFIYYHPWLNSF